MRLFNNQLHLFERGTCSTEYASHYVVAAWHWKWSITWRWLIWWYPPEKNRPFGTFIFDTQENMRIK